MYELVKENFQREIITTSEVVAVKFGKRHSVVLRAIDKLSCSEEFRQRNFTLSFYLSFQNKRIRMYEFTKEGFSLLVKGYKGKKSEELKENFIAEFDKRDALIKNDDSNLTPEMEMQRFRRHKILELSAQKILSTEESLYQNMLVLEGADSILSKLGKECIVVSEKKRNHKLGDCYNNAARMMDKYEYVEGYATKKNTSFRFAHAWNMDSKGNHLDTTISNAEEYDYFGVVIPKSVVYDVGYENGGIWYAALPFIDNLEMKQ